MSAVGSGHGAGRRGRRHLLFVLCRLRLPAGRARVIRDDAFVGWHGNERQFNVLAARTESAWRTNWPRSRRRTSRPAARCLRAGGPALVRGDQKDEAEFYASLDSTTPSQSVRSAMCWKSDRAMQDRSAGASRWPTWRAWVSSHGLPGDGRYERDSSRFRQNSCSSRPTSACAAEVTFPLDTGGRLA